MLVHFVTWCIICLAFFGFYFFFFPPLPQEKNPLFFFFHIYAEFTVNEKW